MAGYRAWIDDDSSYLWAWIDDDFKKVIVNKYPDGHCEWLDGIPERRIKYQGRFDSKKNTLSLTSLSNEDITQVPKDIIQRLKFEFGDDIRIKYFYE